ncbi:DUF4214 domain-containing protein [Pseudoduganella sp. LjRoot289]|uniref:DUF4214 domain-containing protein n=1 Tax=Pseudoduganella sp. LjRoot289 TaxID=3342314 RepID=UPI003ECCBA27
MKANRLCCSAILVLLAACGGDEQPAPASPPRMAATAVMGAAAPFITFSGYRNQYTVAASAGGYTVTDILSGATQQVAANSRLRFGDTALGFDLDGSAGQAYRLYQAAFKRKPDFIGLGFHINSLDNGASLVDVAASFVGSQEFIDTYGTLSNTDFVTLLYANVLGRAPDAGGLAFHVGNLDNARLTRAGVLAQFSDSPENIALVLPDISTGVEFMPWGSAWPAYAIAEYAGYYEVTVSGDDRGAIGITVAADGNMTLYGHLVNQDAGGSGKLEEGGRFVVALGTTGGQSVTLTGSINLASGILTGRWLNTSSGQRGVFSWTKPVVVVPPQLFPQVRAIITQRCVPCHSAQPTIAGFNPAPHGIKFDTEAEIRARSGQIFSTAVQSQFMPWANQTGMTQAERDVLAAWFAAGTP